MSTYEREDDIKNAIASTMSDDFILSPEVWGNCIIDGTRVRIDFMAYPKQHLIDLGFDAQWFGIEAKSLLRRDGNPIHGLGKINQLIWQVISYAQSTFNIDQARIRPMFVLICTDRVPYEYCKEWKTLIGLAQYGNVGMLDLAPRWSIHFSNALYFASEV